VCRTDVESILWKVCQKWGVDKTPVLNGSRDRKTAKVRREFLFLAHKGGASMTELGKLCGLSHVAVSKVIAKAGQELIEEEGALSYISYQRPLR
jgi:chromosomal replication initiation ATPase DnaA